MKNTTQCHANPHPVKVAGFAYVVVLVESQTFKVYPELAAAAVRLRRDKLYRLWTIARSFDGRGEGRLSESELVAFILALDGFRGLSPDYVRRLLRAGNGVFWTLYRKGSGTAWTLYRKGGALWIRLHGLAAVCRALGVTRLYKWPVIIGVEQVRRLQVFRGAVLASQFMGKREWTNPLSRRVLADKLGHNGRTQLNWERAVGAIDKRQNAALRSWQGSLDELPPDTYVDKIDGSLVVLRRLPNSYRANLLQGCRGMLKRVNNALVGESVHIGGTDERKPKLFYRERETKQVCRRLQECEDGDVFYQAATKKGRRNQQRSLSGAYLYNTMSCYDGQVYYG